MRVTIPLGLPIYFFLSVLEFSPGSTFVYFVVYYESMKWKVQTRPLYECRCDERLKTKAEESTCLVYTVLIGMFILVYYESMKRKLKTRPLYECRCDYSAGNEIVWNDFFVHELEKKKTATQGTLNSTQSSGEQQWNNISLQKRTLSGKAFTNTFQLLTLFRTGPSLKHGKNRLVIVCVHSRINKRNAINRVFSRRFRQWRGSVQILYKLWSGVFRRFRQRGGARDNNVSLLLPSCCSTGTSNRCGRHLGGVLHHPNHGSSKGKLPRSCGLSDVALPPSRRSQTQFDPGSSRTTDEETLE